MDYNHRETEAHWQKYWSQNNIFRATTRDIRPKFYVLDMFPYPSGAGLHVGHPLGYIASDIYARYKRLKGFNVLHVMGYDAFGLPAEQYAIETGQHPAITTDQNIKRYRKQLDGFGFSFDWEREFRTSDPKYYKWTQWVFVKLFHSWFDKERQTARPIEDLVAHFEKQGNSGVQAASSLETAFTAQEWKAYGEAERSEILMAYRLAYLADSLVNWCPTLGTVLANDEVSEGFSVRGGHPVERKKMRQWFLRITAYADRLLEGLERIDWPENVKEIQRNWIGKSRGVMLRFDLKDHPGKYLEVFTTRPDTVFGVTFMSISPDHPYVDMLSKPEHVDFVKEYVHSVKNRSERERIADAKKPSGVFTGSYAVNPFNGVKVPVWVADYVIGGYGTGAVMAVPAHDARDFAFAKYFRLPIVEVIQGGDVSETAYESLEGVCVNSAFLDGIAPQEAVARVAAYAAQHGIGSVKINYRLRDAIFSRQRYWGEPFPVYYKDGIPHTLDVSKLPLELPEVDKYLPTEAGEPPLARANKWVTPEGYPYETATMPGFAGSSGYYFRYMDPHNDSEYFSKEAVDYWKSVDFYVGGAEHATGHLIYARFWNKFLFDLGLTPEDEPFKKLFNQGMIQGRSSFVYRVKPESVAQLLEVINKSPAALNIETTGHIGDNCTAPVFISKGIPGRESHSFPVHVDINLVHNDILDVESFRRWRPELKDAVFILEGGRYSCGWEVEKMSKSKYNVQSPDELIERYGADTLRMYEMFLGPVEQSKPWDINGIEGVYRFVRKFWRLFIDERGDAALSDAPADEAELKILHKTVKKIAEDIERFALNTCISSLMICVNELGTLKCRKRAVLEPLLVVVSPFAPHIAEELWQRMGNSGDLSNASFPEWDEAHLVENTVRYPVSFNGKTRFFLVLNADSTNQEVERAVLAAPDAKKWLGEGLPRKIIIVPGRIVNVVV